MEIEVINVGTKPIYYLELLVILPEIKRDEHSIGFPLRYGRIELAEIQTKADASDVPIGAGETYVFKLADSKVVAWEHARQKGNYPQPKRVRLHFEDLSFGDGTGFSGGVFFPSLIPDAQS
ncbi:MAG: hypothetical protein QOE77_2447 [Blastocatellia bacterium]|jgi:hypothetical protein|nr:hypothetical protein [Blastocatellia bacterium]